MLFQQSDWPGTPVEDFGKGTHRIAMSLISEIGRTTGTFTGNALLGGEG
jgi:hypothetical protein